MDPGSYGTRVIKSDGILLVGFSSQVPDTRKDLPIPDHGLALG